MKALFWALVLAVAVLAALFYWDKYETPISGGACSPIGKVKTDRDGQLWTCAKNAQTGNGFWYKGKA